MRKLIAVLIIGLLIVSYFTSCKDDCNDVTNPNCSNYNPCFGESPVVADFKIEEQVGAVLVETDTVYWGNESDFTPTFKYDSVKWLIGSDVVTQNVLKRKEFPKQSWVNVGLIVYKQPNQRCFPTDDGVDTLFKKFYSLTNDDRIVFGYFQGSNTDNPTDTFTISTYYYDSALGKRFNLTNIPKGYTDKFFTDYLGLGGRAFYTTSSNNGPGYRFSLQSTGVVKNNQIVIEYSYNEEALNAWNEGRPPKAPRRVSKTFIGKRL
jgi:hypothetical protein